LKGYIQVFTATESKENAEKMAKTLVRKRLAGCVQTIGPIASVYWWKKRIEKSEEWLCLIKSKRSLYDELEKTIKKFHAYETPEIITMPIVSGNEEYLEWLENELKQK
jgi:periplasmic divalent cation tolerance protein